MLEPQVNILLNQRPQGRPALDELEACGLPLSDDSVIEYLIFDLLGVIGSCR